MKSTTAFDDQFTPATQTVELVRQPYSTEAILKRNVADLEVALRTQTERAEAAEAELLAVREDNHSMMLEIDGMRTELAKLREQEPVAYVKYKTTGGNVGLSWLAVPTGAFYPREGEQLYAAPIPAPAVPAVPDEWKQAVSEFLSSHDAAWAELFKSIPADTRSVTVSNHQADAVRKANVLRALLQSATQAPVVPAEIIELSKKYAIDTEAYHAAMDALLQSAEVRHG